MIYYFIFALIFTNISEIAIATEITNIRINDFQVIIIGRLYANVSIDKREIIPNSLICLRNKKK